MSFLSDLFEGHLDNLGNDITHAPSSLINHPDELIETGAAIAAVALPFVAPEIGAAVGAGELGADIGAGAAAADLGAEGLGAADAAFGAFDPALFAANAADAAGLGAAGVDFASLGEAGLSAADAAFGAFDPGLFAGNLSDAAAGFGGTDFAAADFELPGTSALTSGDPTFAETDAELFGGQTGTAPPSASGGTGAAPTGAGATSTPSGFAPTDAELSGAATGTAPGTSGGGIFSGLTDKLGGVMSSPWTKLALGAAPLALTLGMGEGKLPAAAQQLQQQAAVLSAQGQSDLAAARAGQLNAGQTAQLAQMRQDLTNQWRQTLYNQGVTDVSKDARWPQIEAQIDAQVTQQTATMIQQNITNALAETGQAAQALTAIAQMQLSEDQQFTNNLINATKSLGLAAGLSSIPKITIG